MTERTGVLGLDVGTTSTKAVLLDAAGRVVAGAAREYPLEVPERGWAVQDPDAIVAAVLDAVGEVATAAREQGVDVAGLAVSTAMHSLLALDANRAELVHGWADRALALDPQQHEALDGLSTHRRRGMPGR